ncbi:MAG: DUF5320 domain-containing protein [Candidatus Cloacimonetes bacterium]|nr:DUF5320 domain-containing protein [Candidatus Cloacimonadota bacterium]
MPNRDGTGPYGDGRQGRGLGNCGNSRRTTQLQGSEKNLDNRGYANTGIALLVEAIRYFLSKKPRDRR